MTRLHKKHARKPRALVRKVPPCIALARNFEYLAATEVISDDSTQKWTGITVQRSDNGGKFRVVVAELTHVKAWWRPLPLPELIDE